MLLGRFCREPVGGRQTAAIGLAEAVARNLVDPEQPDVSGRFRRLDDLGHPAAERCKIGFRFADNTDNQARRITHASGADNRHVPHAGHGA